MVTMVTLDYDLIEAECRRDEFNEGISEPIVLADGQTWFIPGPYLTIHPVIRPVSPRETPPAREKSLWPAVFFRPTPVEDFPAIEVVATSKYLSYGPKLDPLIKAIRDAEDFGVRVQLIQVLGRELLRRNYKLDDDEIEVLLTFRVNDRASLQMIDDIIAVATGGEPAPCQQFPN